MIEYLIPLGISILIGSYVSYFIINNRSNKKQEEEIQKIESRIDKLVESINDEYKDKFELWICGTLSTHLDKEFRPYEIQLRLPNQENVK